MQVTVVAEPSIQAALRKRVSADISAALQAVVTVGPRFVVNDSIWYARKRRGGVSPCVVNSASYISKRFQSALEQRPGWHAETAIYGQKIDGYGEFHEQGIGYGISRERVFKFLDEYVTRHLPPDVDIGSVTARVYGMFVARNLFELSDIPESLRHYFDPRPVDAPVRIGVEFETGNIASSFRALTKLGNLFSAGKIDAGVFVTSIDKPNCAARIWPVSNRNGSFQELIQRRYKDNIALPLWEVGFAPDAFDPSAKYLGIDGSLYSPVPARVIAEEDVEIDGVRYTEWRGERGDALLRPKSHV
jgi:hypothetical protein